MKQIVIAIGIAVLGLSATPFTTSAYAQTQPECVGEQTPEVDGCRPWYVDMTPERVEQIALAIYMTPAEAYQSWQAGCNIAYDMIKVMLSAAVLFSALMGPEFAILTFIFGFDMVWMEAMKIYMCNQPMGG